LSINRPRRIFRSGLPRPEAKALAIAAGVALMAAAGVFLAVLPHTKPLPPAPAPREELSARPAEVAVVDGGSLRLRDRVVILAGMNPPPRGTLCGQRDGPVADCGATATNALAAFVQDRSVTCQVTGSDRIGRPLAVCRANSTELNRAMIEAGWARAGRGRTDLKQVEETARAERRGVWASNP
jgi:endonuclease YncB( thermonuclease family)